MVAKGISQDDFPENGVRRQTNRSLRIRTMTVREVLQNIRLGGQSHIFTDTFGSVFSKTTRFVLKMMFFSYMA